ncbi:MAG: hypothetical protein AAGI11_18040 [Pseudomonadota bacterium]
MYRYSVDNAITYTSEDFVLFKESPFASWMERLTLENPDHGIEPDPGSEPPQDTLESQADLADLLRAEGKRVKAIDWQLAEPVRRTATLEALRYGIDFIVDGQLALGPLSGSANLLMRTSGYSDLGNFLYLPCDTQGRTTLHSAFRLCFLADLLHSLQGQLPPQLLIIRGGQEVLPLNTEDHIYHYRAVKKRFMDAQRQFRKHRMPDPAESSHCGRWSLCANEVLKQRLLSEPEQPEEALEPAPQMPLADALAASLAPAPQATGTATRPVPTAGTLAEQAQRLPPKPSVDAAESRAPLENLSFIGSSQGIPVEPEIKPAAVPSDSLSPVPAPPARSSAAAAEPRPFPDKLDTRSLGRED